VAAFLYIAALMIAAGSVSALGAAFSVRGLMRLFAGAPIAVALMASSLEFSKFVVAAFLHRGWDRLNRFYRTYLLVSVIVLSAITSMGIFGFLSDAYQTSSKDLVADQIKTDALKAEQARNTAEIERINRAIDEIPATRISKKIQARKDVEPVIRELTQKSDKIAEELKQMNLNTLDIKTKVGPLIYVAKVFNQDIDTIVKWLILVFVGVFDPLAICLVIATSEALKLKSMGLLQGSVLTSVTLSSMPEPMPAPVAPAPAREPIRESKVQPPIATAEPMPLPEAPQSPGLTTAEPAPAQDKTEGEAEDEDAVKMRYVDDPKAG
jgi:hypothetical protein